MPRKAAAVASTAADNDSSLISHLKSPPQLDPHTTSHASALDQSSTQAKPTSPSRPQTTIVEMRSPRPQATASGVNATEKKERKSIGGQTSGANATGSSSTKEKDKEGKESKKAKEKEEMSIDDLLLPRTLISRLARGSLPPNTSLQKDALLALTKSATVFISYLSHTANTLTSRKTIQVDDVLKAISEMELDGVMRDRLEKEIGLFEEGVRDKRKGYRDRMKARESGVSQIDGDAGDEMSDNHVHKRLKSSFGDDNEERDIEMEGTGTSSAITKKTTKKAIRNADDDDDPSAQLLHEASQAAEYDDSALSESEGDATEDDDEVGEDEGVVENEEEEDEDEEDDEEREGEDGMDEDNDNDEDGERNRQGRKYLAPDGRAEVDASDDDNDDDGDSS